MYARSQPITPSQLAVNGALDLFVDGHRKDNTRQMLVGLAVLSSATEAQAQAAMLFVQKSQRLSTHALANILAN